MPYILSIFFSKIAIKIFYQLQQKFKKLYFLYDTIPY